MISFHVKKCAAAVEGLKAEVSVCVYVCVVFFQCACVDMTYLALEQQTPARRVPHCLLISVHQLSTTKQTNSWRETITRWSQQKNGKNI